MRRALFPLLLLTAACTFPTNADKDEPAYDVVCLFLGEELRFDNVLVFFDDGGLVLRSSDRKNRHQDTREIAAFTPAVPCVVTRSEK